MSPAPVTDAGRARRDRLDAATAARSAALRASAAVTPAARLRIFETALEVAARAVPPRVILDEHGARLTRSRLIAYGMAYVRTHGLPVDEPLTFPAVLTASVASALALAEDFALYERERAA